MKRNIKRTKLELHVGHVHTRERKNQMRHTTWAGYPLTGPLGNAPYTFPTLQGSASRYPGLSESLARGRVRDAENSRASPRSHRLCSPAGEDDRAGLLPTERGQLQIRKLKRDRGQKAEHRCPSGDGWF